MNFLIDYNLQKYAAILLGKIANDGWLDLIPIALHFSTILIGQRIATIELSGSYLRRTE
jgi:hypothetical protein